MPDQPIPLLEIRDRRRARLIEQLASLGPGPVALYRDACRIFDGLILAETASHLAGHLQRELLSSVQDVLLPPDYAEPKAGDDPKIVQALLRALCVPLDSDVTRLRRALRQHFKPQGGNAPSKVKVIAQALGLSVEHEIVGLSKELKLHSIAHRSGLDAPPALESVVETWERFQRLLSLLLDFFEKSYALAYGKIRAAIAAYDLAMFRTMVPQNFATLSYFFERIDGDRWFQLLRQTDMLTVPPSGGGWPALDYLARITAGNTSDVRDVLLRIESTENEFVLMGIINAAKGLPASDAVRVLERLCADISALRAEAFVYRDFAMAAGEYASAEPERVLSLLRPLLELRVRDQPTGGYGGSRELTARVDVHAYSDIIQGPLQAVAVVRPKATLSFLAELLDEALRSEYGEPPLDYSNTWRPAIEPHSQNHYYEPLPHLVEALRLAAERVSLDSSDAALDAIETVRSRQWLVFRRLALHLARVALPPTHSLVHQFVLDRQTLIDENERHEAHLLFAHTFPHLTDLHQRQIIDTVLAGPPADDQNPRSESRRNRWVFTRLAWVADHLPQDAQRVYETLGGRAGESDPTMDFDVYSTGMWIGPTSPKTTAEMEAMPLPELVAFLREWSPPRGMMADTREGVARLLTPAVQARAIEMSQAAERFVGLDATFVRAVVSGLTDAANKDVAFAWQPLLQLAAWAVAQPREIPGRTRRDLDDDPDWGWTRAQIARLLQRGFVNGATQIPIAYRGLVWGVLQPLMDDPDPDNTRDGNNDPLNTAINSTRGTAFEAAIGYAAWVRSGYFQPPNVDGPPFHDMPELLAVFDRHLDQSIDPSPAIRAVFGKNLYYLYRLAPDWVLAEFPRLFPKDSPPLADAVWQTYLVYSPRFSQEITRDLRPIYERAVDSIGSGEPLYREYSSQLGSHLLYQYLAGHDGFEPSSLLDRFFRNADADIRTRVVGFVPHSLEEFENGDIRQQVERAEAFWRWRLQVSTDGADLRGFGLWMPSARFDPVWRLTQLRVAVDRAGVPIHEHAVIDTLPSLAASQPALVLSSLAALVEQAGGYMQLYRLTYTGQIEAILRDALASVVADVRASARQLVNTLIAKGFTKLLDLLEPPDTPPTNEPSP